MGYDGGMCSHESTPRGVFDGRVVRNERVCPEHYWMTLFMEGEFPATSPGQFVQVQCRSAAEPPAPAAVEWTDDTPPSFTQPEFVQSQPLLRRPLSLAGRRDVSGGTELEIIYRVVGAGTGFLETLDPGSVLSLLGPLGNAFPIVADKPKAALIGGGVGMPPMLYLSEAMGIAGKHTVAFCGARSAHLLPIGPDEFDLRGAKQMVATDDGTMGHHGLVTDALLEWMSEDAIRYSELVVYACGPEPMMRAVGNICDAHGIECYLSLERIMACGMGTCQSCAVKVEDETADEGWRYKLCCSDGPVFEASTLLW